MVASGDWITPRLNGFKYFEKPAFQYWATAAGYTLFGESTATARLWPALAGFLGALWVGFVGRRLYGTAAGFHTFLIAVSGLLYVAVGHNLTLDMTVSVFVVIGIGSLAIAQSNRADPRQVRNWMLGGWAALALATLTKGLIGIVLPAAAAALYLLWQRDWALLRHLHLGKGLLLYLALAAPWFVAVSIANPEFPRFFFIQEHLERYTTTIHDRVEPFWYFVPVFVLGALPWVMVTLRSLARPRFAWRAPAGGSFDAERFLWVFVVSVFAFFSLGQSKLAGYILPIMPVAAILAGRRLAESGRTRADAYPVLVLGALLLLVGWQAERFATSLIPAQLYLDYRPWAIGAGAVLLAAGLLALKAEARRPRLFAAYGLACLLGFQLMVWGAQSLSSSRSSHAMAEAIRAAVPAATDIYIVESYYPQSLPFYLGRTVTFAGGGIGELSMGMQQEPQRWLPTGQDFLARWEQADQAVAVFDSSVFERYQQLGIPMRVIYQGARRTAVTKP
jgi:4-amino-4-deoxy-L-arabinose transferase-like glycosyltransferase